MGQPGIVGIARRRRAEMLPARILGQAFIPPVGNVERRVGKTVIELQIGEGVAREAALIVPGDFRIDA